MLAAAEHPVQPHSGPVWIAPCLEGGTPTRTSGSSIYPAAPPCSESPQARGDIDVPGYSRLMGRTRRGLTYASKRISASWFIPKSTPTVADRQEYWERPAGGIPECSRGGAVCCRIQLGMIPLGLNSMATISIFAHWTLALRAEAQHDKR